MGGFKPPKGCVRCKGLPEDTNPELVRVTGRFMLISDYGTHATVQIGRQELLELALPILVSKFRELLRDIETLKDWRNS